jgi:hypothetical protein
MFWFVIVSWTSAEFFSSDYDLTGRRSEISMKEEKIVISCMSFQRTRPSGTCFQQMLHQWFFILNDWHKEEPNYTKQWCGCERWWQSMKTIGMGVSSHKTSWGLTFAIVFTWIWASGSKRENGCTFFCRLSQSMWTRERHDGGGMGNETFCALGISSSTKNEKWKQ